MSELLRSGAGRLIYQAVEAELQEMLTEHAERQTGDGKAEVVTGIQFKDGVEVTEVDQAAA